MNQPIIARTITYFGHPVVVCCDAGCECAWGRNYVGKRDFPAPADPGTYEGPDGKPQAEGDRLNRWCVRECERSVIIPLIRVQDHA